MVLAVVAAWITTDREDRYTAGATLFVGTTPSDTSVVAGEVSGDRQTGFSLLATTFTQMIDSHPVAAEAIERAGIDRGVDAVLDATEATNPIGTQLIDIEVTDEDPAVAQALADAMSTAFIEVLEEQERAQQQSREDTELSAVTLYAPARLPAEPLDSGLARNLTLGLVFGLVAAGALVLLLEYLDLTVRTPDDAERRVGLPVLGTIPEVGGGVVAPGVRVPQLLGHGDG